MATLTKPRAWARTPWPPLFPWWEALPLVQAAVDSGRGLQALPPGVPIELDVEDLDRLSHSVRLGNRAHRLIWNQVLSQAAGYVDVLQSRPVRCAGNRVVLAAHNRKASGTVSYAVLGSYNLRTWESLGSLNLSGFGPGEVGIGGLSHGWIRVRADSKHQAPAEIEAVVVFSRQ